MCISRDTVLSEELQHSEHVRSPLLDSLSPSFQSPPISRRFHHRGSFSECALGGERVRSYIYFVCLWILLRKLDIFLPVRSLAFKSSPGWMWFTLSCQVIQAGVFWLMLGESGQNLMCNIQSHVAEWGHLHGGGDRCRTRVNDSSLCAAKEHETQNVILCSVSMSICCSMVICLFQMSPLFTYLFMYVCFCAPSTGH